MAPNDKMLDSLRQEIDAIDDAIGDLLAGRVAISDRIRVAKGRHNAPPFIPGREAQILRRLVARGQTAVPPELVVRVWREILSASVRQQGLFTAAAYTPADNSRYLDLARDHFSNLTPLVPMASIGAVVSAVLERRAHVGIVPLPEDSPSEVWWRGFGVGAARALQVLFRLPFAPIGPGAAALVIGCQPFEPTGEDRGYLVVETDGEISRTRFKAALDAAGLQAINLIAAPEDKKAPAAATWPYLIETEAWCPTGDPRLANVFANTGGASIAIRSIGGYPVPLKITAPTHSRRK
jgi:chorismate mutase